VYYRLCGPHPDMFVFNDETLLGEEGKETCERLIKGLGKPIGQEVAEEIQCVVEANDTSTSRIAACASCNEILYGCHCNIVETTMEKLHDNFCLTQDQVQALKAIPGNLVRDVLSVYQYGGKMYYLNPDLIPDSATIVLCKVCAKDPKDHKFLSNFIIQFSCNHFRSWWCHPTCFWLLLFWDCIAITKMEYISYCC